MKLSQLRQKLGQKAKQEPKFRFYVLYDRIYRQDPLKAAWHRVRQNGGAPGVDGQTIEGIEATGEGLGRLLEEIQQSLQSKTYQPSAVRRVWKPKVNGKAFAGINQYVHVRPGQHLRRRSQRPYRRPPGVSAYQHYQQLGWCPLRAVVAQLPVKPKATDSAKAGCGKPARPV